jgi:UDP-N-acetylglucosamine--N-acetylmuramyl-(pentapeptide) pyrophosphoryl-undecaprenol N-acetylglucosamine transferase
LLTQNGNAGKMFWTGNPVRSSLLASSSELIKSARQRFELSDFLPTILITGGGIGATGLNNIVQEVLPELVKICQVIHSTGAGKGVQFKHQNYRQFALISEMAEAYAIADIVVSRAGLSTITELSALGKVSIVVPMPQSHQLYNAKFLDVMEAAVVLDQEQLDGPGLVYAIRKLIHDGDWQKELSENIRAIMPHDATEKISEIIERLCRKEKN